MTDKLFVQEGGSNLEWTRGDDRGPLRYSQGTVLRRAEKYASYYAEWEILQPEAGIWLHLDVGGWSVTASWEERAGINARVFCEAELVITFEDCYDGGGRRGLSADEARADGRVLPLVTAIVAQDTFINAMAQGGSDEKPPRYEWQLWGDPEELPPLPILPRQRRLSFKQIAALFALEINECSAPLSLIRGPAKPPTDKSLQHINKALGIALPSSFIKLMKSCPDYWLLYAGLGPDYDGAGHILTINEEARKYADASGQYWTPSWLVQICPQSGDGDAIGFDKRCYDKKTGEYPVVYWHADGGKYHRAESAYADFLEYAEACINWWVDHLKPDTDTWHKVQAIIIK